MKWLPDEETLELWSSAAQDAGVDPASAHIFVAPATDEGYGAMHYPPGMWAVPGDRSFDLSGGLRVRVRELRTST